MNALQTLLKTRDVTPIFIARVALGLVIFPHGAQEVLGWFGGFGFSGTMGFFTGWRLVLGGCVLEPALARCFSFSYPLVLSDGRLAVVSVGQFG